MNILSFEFEELPLVIAPGIEAALVNGLAEVEYTRDGEWQIKSISVEGHQRITQAERDAGKSPWVYIPASVALEHVIVGRLDNEWRDKVQSAVGEQIAEDRQCAADDRADMRRDQLMMERG